MGLDVLNMLINIRKIMKIQHYNQLLRHINIYKYMAFKINTNV